MKAIILAAGKDSRLGDICRDKPKCLMDIEDNTLLEIQINTLHACGIEDICIVRGYEGGQINLPGLRYYDNPDYSATNTLYSLFCAREELNEEVIILYSDIIYEEQVVKRVIESTHDIALGVMVNWKEAFQQRDSIAREEFEMVYFDPENRVQKIGKTLSEEYETQGQFTGMVKCARRGAEILTANYNRARMHCAGKRFGRAKVFEMASETDLFQEMTELGVPLHCVIIERGWMEIDTPQDYERALTDTKFVRRLVKKKTNWDERAKFYNDLDWVNRDQLLNTIVELTGDLNNKKVLDLGTGTGKVLIALKQKYPKGEYYGVDISRRMLEKVDASYNFNLSIGEIEKLSDFKNNDFDLVTARMVFHHAANLDEAMKQACRVLKPGGRFILCEGNPPDYHCLEFYKEMFRFKEDRITFLLDDMVNCLVKQNFRDITSRTVILKKMSLNDWLAKSALPFRNIDIIRKIHFNCPDHVKKAYNMKFQNDDILMDWKFSVVSGTK